MNEPVMYHPTIKHSTPADVGHDLFISDYVHCDTHGHQYDRIIHIWRPSQGALRCRQVLGGKPNGLAIQWTEMQSYSEMSVTVFPALAGFVAQPGRVLIHCQAGMGRAPCVALLGKVFRGCDPFDALRDIQRANWEQRRMPFGLWGNAINEAVEFWEHWRRRTA